MPDKEFALIVDSDLFDEDWYFFEYPAARMYAGSPLEHFLRFGAAMGLKPNPFFDTSWYVEANSEARHSAMNPLLHYISLGHKEGCVPCRAFDPQALDMYSYYWKFFAAPNVAAGATAGACRQFGGGPPITILMAVYNGAAFLHEAVNSILGQTFSDFMFLIIDDASTDATSRILYEYCCNDSRMLVLTNKKRSGLTESLNRGISEVSTPYIARMDADDVSMPYRLERQLLFMESNPAVVVLGGGVCNTDSRGNRLSFHPKSYTPVEVEEALRAQGSVLPHPSVLMRTQAVKDAGGYRFFFQTAQDFDLWLRLAEKGLLATLGGKAVLRYRRHPDSVTRNRSLRQAVDHVLAVASYESRTKSKPEPLPVREPAESALPTLLEAGSLAAFHWLAQLCYRNISSKHKLIAQALELTVPHADKAPPGYALESILLRMIHENPREALPVLARHVFALQSNGLLSFIPHSVWSHYLEEGGGEDAVRNFFVAWQREQVLYMRKEAASLAGRKVYFWGGGSVYERYKVLFEKTRPQCILLDIVPASGLRETIGGMPVRFVQEMPVDAEALPIIIFARFLHAWQIKQKIEAKYMKLYSNIVLCHDCCFDEKAGKYA